MRPPIVLGSWGRPATFKTMSKKKPEALAQWQRREIAEMRARHEREFEARIQAAAAADREAKRPSRPVAPASSAW